MKKILLALALSGVVTAGAEAQSSANSKFAKNYPICLADGKYQVCDANTVSSNTEPNNSFGMQTVTVHMGYGQGSNVRYRSRVRVTYDDPNAPYLGKESMANDGVEINKYRNLNANKGGVYIPPSDGGLSDR